MTFDTAHRGFTDIPDDVRIIPLKGFSGCAILLVEDETGASHVRKIARDLSYNPRLLRQAAKQSAYPANDFRRAINVREVGVLPSGLAYIDMDYIPGVTAAEALVSIPLTEIPRWADMLLRFAEPSDVPRHKTLAVEIFQDKIRDIDRELTLRNLKTTSVQKSLDRLKSLTWTGVPASPCHGDLTFENIIVYKGQLYLFDFLDSFAETWYADIAKLMQDLIGGWSFRHREINRNLALRLAALRHSLEAGLQTRYPGCLPVIHALYVLALLRVLPYCALSFERTFIDQRLTSAINTIL
jgi:hypothetical protein